MTEIRHGDLVRCIPGGTTNQQTSGSGYQEGLEFTVGHVTVAYDGRRICWGGKKQCGVYENWLELVNKEGEEVEEVKPEEYVRVARNTEMFKKGSVFKYEVAYGFYRAQNKEAFLDEDSKSRFDAPRISVETVERLSKVFVPVQKFDPEFVTAEENERLQAVLSQPSARKVARKTKK